MHLVKWPIKKVHTSSVCHPSSRVSDVYTPCQLFKVFEYMTFIIALSLMQFFKCTFFTLCIVMQLLQIWPTKCTHYNILIYKTPTFYRPHWHISLGCAVVQNNNYGVQLYKIIARLAILLYNCTPWLCASEAWNM